MIRLEIKSDSIVPVDSEQMMAAVKDVLVSAIETNFRVGGRPTWAAKRDGSPSYLRKTGALAGSIKGTSGKTWAEVAGGVTPQGRVQQFGATIPLQPRAASSLLSTRESRMYSGSRACFWFMWYTTQDRKWKYMAMTRNNTIRLPARPWMKLTGEDYRAILNAVKGNLFRVKRNF